MVPRDYRLSRIPKARDISSVRLVLGLSLSIYDAQTPRPLKNGVGIDLWFVLLAVRASDEAGTGGETGS